VTTPPTSPHPFFDTLEDLPPRTTNPPPPKPMFDFVERLASHPLPVPDVIKMEPPLPPLSPQLSPFSQPMWSNDLLPPLTHETFYVNDVMRSKKKTVMVTSDPLALIAEKTNVSRSKEKAVISSNSKGSEADDFKFVKTDNKRVEKKDDEKKRDMSRVKDKDEQVLLAKDQAWMESSSDSDQEINANMVFMAQIKKVLSDSEASSSSADEKISEVSYYLSESESESEFETLEYYDNFTNYGLFVNNDDDQENFHDAIDSASENFIENHIDSQKDYDKSDVDHIDSKEKDQLVDKLITKS
nr:hypothetical protein [Tanacetum cinerariifolium]